MGAPTPAPTDAGNATCQAQPAAGQQACCEEKLANGVDDIWCLQAFPAVRDGAGREGRQGGGSQTAWGNPGHAACVLLPSCLPLVFPQQQRPLPAPPRPRPQLFLDPLATNLTTCETPASDAAKERACCLAKIAKREGDAYCSNAFAQVGRGACCRGRHKVWWPPLRMECRHWCSGCAGRAPQPPRSCSLPPLSVAAPLHLMASRPPPPLPLPPLQLFVAATEEPPAFGGNCTAVFTALQRTCCELDASDKKNDLYCKQSFPAVRFPLLGMLLPRMLLPRMLLPRMLTSLLGSQQLLNLRHHGNWSRLQSPQSAPSAALLPLEHPGPPPLTWPAPSSPVPPALQLYGLEEPPVLPSPPTNGTVPPTDPTKPTDPTQPQQPPTQPEQPEQPPTQPEQPQQPPTQPEQPQQPEQPTEPEQPQQPTKPTKPAKQDCGKLDLAEASAW